MYKCPIGTSESVRVTALLLFEFQIAPLTVSDLYFPLSGVELMTNVNVKGFSLRIMMHCLSISVDGVIILKHVLESSTLKLS